MTEQRKLSELEGPYTEPGLDEKTGVDRRIFLAGVGSAAGLSMTGLGLATAHRSREAGEPVAPAASAASDFELEDATFGDLQQQLRSGALTTRSLARRYLERIEALNREGPDLRHVIETNPQALEIAEALDEERRQGRVRGPLHGIPILLKDNIDTGDRMHTSAGSLALAGSTPARDSFVASRLRAAGALLLGKANLSEWANFRSTRSSSGWSARGGQCRNPYALDRNPCGSSAGSGAAVSANLCAGAIGTETDGSIVCPASANGIVGVKPTLGLVSRSGIVPIAHSQDTAGPMARTVTDAAHLLAALTGVDPRDEATGSSEGRARSDYAELLDPGALRGARIGVARQTFGFHPQVDELMEQSLLALREAEAEVIDPVELAGIEDVEDPELEVLLYEFKHDLNLYLAALGAGAAARSLEELIRFNVEHRAEEMPYFGQEIFEQAQEKGPLSESGYRQALALCRLLARTEGLDATLHRHRLDALVAPTGGPAWLTDLVHGDNFSGGSSMLPAVAGYPNVTVPAGFVFGLPVGISFIGAPWSEVRLLGLAYAFEQATGHRRAPRLLSTVSL